MPNDKQNIYQIARKAAGLTQEKAAELLPVSVRSLRDYEEGQRVPGNDVVERMCVVYNAQHLAYQHLHETNGLLCRIVPELEPRGLMEIAMRTYNRMARFEQSHGLNRLMAIAEDGVIDANERAEFDAILDDITELVACGMELKIYTAEKDAGPLT